MTCKNDKLALTRGKKEILPLSLTLDKNNVDLGQYRIEFCVAPLDYTSWRDNTGLTIHEVKQPGTNEEQYTSLITIDGSDTELLEDQSYKRRIKYTLVENGSDVSSDWTEVYYLNIEE